MAQPKVYLRPKPSKDGKHQILISYFIQGKRLEYYTGISIKKTDFKNTGEHSIKSTALHSASFNQKIKNIKADAVKFATEAKGDDINPKFIREQLDAIYKPREDDNTQLEQPKETSFIKYFEKAINDSKAGKRLISTGKRNGSRYSLRAIKNYSVSLSAIKRYLEYSELKDLSFDDIDKDFYNGFRDFCYNIENKEKSTFAGYIKDIKTLMSESEHLFKTKDFVLPSYESDTIYLTNEEIDKISNIDLSDSTKHFTNIEGEKIFYPTLDRVRDLYLIGAYSGLRFSDLQELELNSIEGNFIRLKQAKTGARVAIPVMSKLKPIILKYPDQLPTISNQKFNQYIKYVAELAGLNEVRTIKNTKGNKENSTKHPLYSLITSHSCRRSYATNMFKAGVPPMLIMSATGHKTESSFLKYIRATNEDKAKLLAEALNKLGL
nr:tyrosine-type recombinase/integrase [uncultured Pedobacter sp.]